MQKHLRELFAVKRAQQVRIIREHVRQIRYYKAQVAAQILRHPGCQKAIQLNGDQTWWFKRMYKLEMESRQEIALAARRVYNIDDTAFMYKCMELVRLFGESGIVMASATEGTYDGQHLRLIWAVHLDGPAVELSLKPKNTEWYRRCGNASYYATQIFNNRILDLTLGG
jgi:hypothetical protein